MLLCQPLLSTSFFFCECDLVSYLGSWFILDGEKYKEADSPWLQRTPSSCVGEAGDCLDKKR